MPVWRFTKSLSPYTIPDLEPVAPHSSFPSTLYHSYGPRTQFHVWDVVLQIYCASSLSHSSDKLVAISGIARELAPRMHSKYLAGLWEVQLARQLLWIVKPASKFEATESTSSIVMPYRAPSWSWAATDRPLKMAFQWDYRGSRNHRDFLIDVVNTHVVPAEGHDTFGQVSVAELSLRGRLVAVSLTRIEDSGKIEDGKGWYGVLLDEILVEGVTIFEDRQIEDLRVEMFCLPVSVSISVPDVSLDRRTQVYGLLLERLVDGSYRRIGVFMAPNGKDLLTDRVPDAEENRKRARNFDWRNCPQWHLDGGKKFGEDVFTLV